MLALRAGAAVSTKLIVMFLLLVLAAADASSSNRRCYLCGPRDQGFKQTCDQFDSNPQKFIHECDNIYSGCTINNEGSEVIRECSEFNITDCKMLNNVSYCFCTTDLCNKAASLIIINDDDEDIMDGSGAEDVFKDLPTTVPPASTASSLTCKVILLMISIMVH